jgi:hypothetical protein
MYEIIDGAHRWSAIEDLLTMYGAEQIFKWLKGNTVSCQVLVHDTPKTILIQIANTKNASNSVYQVMTYMDQLENLLIFVQELAVAMSPKTIPPPCYLVDVTKIWTAWTQKDAIGSYQDIQKKVSLVLSIYTVTDYNACQANPVAHHDPDTKITTWMELLLQDGMDYQHLAKLRNFILSARMRDGEGDNAALEVRSEKNLKTLWKQSGMYPSLFTSERGNQYAATKKMTSGNLIQKKKE